MELAAEIHHAVSMLKLYGHEPRPFRYHDRGSLVSLSRFTSVGMLMGNLTGGSFFIEGGLARLMYISLYRLHQATEDTAADAGRQVQPDGSAEAEAALSNYGRMKSFSSISDLIR